MSKYFWMVKTKSPGCSSREIPAECVGIWQLIYFFFHFSLFLQAASCLGFPAFLTSSKTPGFQQLWTGTLNWCENKLTFSQAGCIYPGELNIDCSNFAEYVPQTKTQNISCLQVILVNLRANHPWKKIYMIKFHYIQSNPEGGRILHRVYHFISPRSYDSKQNGTHRQHGHHRDAANAQPQARKTPLQKTLKTWYTDTLEGTNHHSKNGGSLWMMINLYLKNGGS